jgi:hypothetical protein
VLELARGRHFLHVWNRDDGFRLDKIVLRLQAEPPVGLGPPESRRGPAAGGKTNNRGTLATDPGRG